MFSKQGFITNIFSLLIVAVSQAVFAQDNLGEDSTVRYPTTYFSEWAPVTAQDMLDRIPGLDAGGSFGPPGGGGFGGGPPGGGGFGGGPPPGFFWSWWRW